MFPHVEGGGGMSSVISGNHIEQNCQHLQTDACIRALIKINRAKFRQLRLAYYNTF